MVDYPATVGALVFVPIIIAASAAFVAVKTTDIFKSTIDRWQAWNPSLPGLKHKKACITTPPQGYGDSFCDLESAGGAEDTVIGQATDIGNAVPTPAKIWHPHRSHRLTWAFSGPPPPQSQDRSHYGLSSVRRPSAVAQIPTRSQSHIVTHRCRSTSRNLRPRAQTDP